MWAELNDQLAAELASCEHQCAVLSAQQEESEAAAVRLLSRHREAGRGAARCVYRLGTRLTLVESDAQQLCVGLKHAASLAHSISSKVLDLDTAKSRVVDCLQRLEDMLDVRLCTEGVTTALAAEEYEQAAQHIHRFLSLDQHLWTGLPQKPGQKQTNFGDSDDAQSLKRSYDILKEAQSKLQSVVASKFSEAVRSDDAASVERFFKLFPLVGQHELGMQQYGAHLCTKLSAAARANLAALQGSEECTGASTGKDELRAGVLYADALTLLFEAVARIVEVHLPLVLASYGPKFTLSLVRQLHTECDAQADQILDKFDAVRQFAQRARQAAVRRHAVGSVAAVDAPAAAPGQDLLDASLLDALLSEAALIHTRAELYSRFLRRKVASGDFDSFYSTTSLSRRMQELIGHYVGIEQFFMEQCVVNVLQSSEAKWDESGGGDGDEMVEDIFFVLRKSIRRAQSTGSVDCVCAVLNGAATLLETRLCSALSTALRKGYPSVGSLAEAYSAAAAAVGSIHAGKMGGPVDAADRLRLAFLTALNRSAAAAAGIHALVRSTLAECERHLGERMQCALDRAKVDNSLEQLNEVAAKLDAQCCSSGVQALVAGAIKPRLKAAAATFLDYNHQPTEEEFADYEANDPFIEAFILTFDNTVTAFQQQLFEENYQALVWHSAVEAGVQLEKVVRRCSYNRLGALQLDKEVRRLCNYLSSVAGWEARAKLARLAALAAALAAESVEEARELLRVHSGRDGSANDAGPQCKPLRPIDADLAPLVALRVDM